MEQVGLAEADAAVEEERVVGARGQLGDGLAGGLGELVAGPHDERVEGVPGIERLEGGMWAGRRTRLERGAGSRSSRSPALVDDDGDPRSAAQALGGGGLQGRHVALQEPVAREAVGRADSEVITFEGDEAAWTDPGIDGRGGNAAGNGFDESVPKAGEHRQNPHLHTQLSTRVDNWREPLARTFDNR